MKTYIECLACLVRQAIDIANANLDEEKREGFMRFVLKGLSTFDYRNSPPMMARQMYGRIRELSGIDDPYKDIKKHYNDKALQMYRGMKDTVNKSPDPFETALRLAIAGNIIDFGAGGGHDISLDDTVKHALRDPFAIDFSHDLRSELEGASTVLYIGDNAGEVVFDRIFIEEIGPEKVTFVTRDIPIINDVTIEDATYVGMDKVCNVVSSGSTAPGTPLEICSEDFKDMFLSSDIVISKGQGNFETLSSASREIFFVLMVKCPVISREIGAEVGSLVVLKKPSPTVDSDNDKPIEESIDVHPNVME